MALCKKCDDLEFENGENMFVEDDEDDGAPDDIGESFEMDCASRGFHVYRRLESKTRTEISYFSRTEQCL